MMTGRGKRRGGSDGAGGASDQGGAGGGGAGGWVHLSDVGLVVLTLSDGSHSSWLRIIFQYRSSADSGVLRGGTRQTLAG